MSKENDFRLIDDENTIVLTYKHDGNSFDLIYDKEKDKVLLVKNGKPADHKKLTERETELFSEFLDVVIVYHHDIDKETELH